jgi:hypothetical protein
VVKLVFGDEGRTGPQNCEWDVSGAGFMARGIEYRFKKQYLSSMKVTGRFVEVEMMKREDA